MMLTSQENNKTEYSVQNSNAEQHMQMHEYKLFHNYPQYYYMGFLSTSFSHEVLFRPSANHWRVEIIMLTRNINPVLVPLSQLLHCSSTCVQCQWGSSHWLWTPRSPGARALSWSWGLPEGENHPVASKKAGSCAGSLFVPAAHRHDGVVRPGSPPVRNTKEILVFSCCHGSKISWNLLTVFCCFQNP